MTVDYSITKEILLLGITLNTSLGAFALLDKEDNKYNYLTVSIHKPNNLPIALPLIIQGKHEIIFLKDKTSLYKLEKKSKKVADWCFTC